MIGLFALFIGSQPVRAQAPGFDWAADRAPSPVARFESLAAVLDNTVYVFGGYADGLDTQVRSDAYDPAADTWTRLADLPAPTTHAGITTAGGQIYFAGGFVGDYRGTATDAVFIYDPETDTFTEGPSLPARRASGALVHHLGTLHWISGLMPDRNTNTTEHWVLDLDDLDAGWSEAAPIPQGKCHFSAVSFNSKIYVLGGQLGHDRAPDDVSTAHVYDPQTDSWNRVADLPTDRSHYEPGTFVWNGQIVLAGGKSDEQNAATLSSIIAYDPVADTWSELGTLPRSLRAPVVQAVGDQVVTTTGGSENGINAESATAAAPISTAPRLLFVRGGNRTGGFLEATSDAGRTEQLSDVFNTSTASGNHGWSAFREALEAEGGFTVEQILEGVENPSEDASGPADGVAIDFDLLDLDAYEAIVFGSNNAVYDEDALQAVERYVRQGGAALFISDANFGSNWADAPNSDQQFLDRFGGLTMNQDSGLLPFISQVDGEFTVPSHPVFEGVNAFTGEGVSPITVDSDATAEGVTTRILARSEEQVRLNTPPFDANEQGQTRSATAQDAALVVALAGNGRIAGHFDRNTFFNENGAGASLSEADNRPYALNLFDWLTSEDEPLPVELVGFAAQVASERQVNLQWETASETGNQGFAVQRRVENGASGSASFEQIAFLRSQAGDGTTNAAQRYAFTDQDLPYTAQRVTYRLLQVDLDGTSTLGPVRTIEVGAPDRLALQPPFPNPTRDRATLRYALPEAAVVHLTLYDALGRKVKTLVAGEAQAAGRRVQLLETGSLASGIYFARLTAETSSGPVTKTRKVVVVQ